ncbi:MAG TPA: hypothetical protein VJ788_05875 [Gemmatimonadota bacterium]|nr:hypothetical protein [Gemmatimonadota bacterium]
MSEPLQLPETPAALPALVAELEEAVRLEEGESLERAYVFEPVERGEVSFTLALVTKRLGPERLEMVALGGRVEGQTSAARDFVRRASFPDSVLPEILAEFIDRCGVEGALYREIPLSDRAADAVPPLERLAAELLAPSRAAP